MILQSRGDRSDHFSLNRGKANGSRIASTIRIRPTVAMAGATSSRTARATIQLPDQRSSVANRTSQAVKRIEAHYGLRAKFASCPRCKRPAARSTTNGLKWDQKQAEQGGPYW